MNARRAASVIGAMAFLALGTARSEPPPAKRAARGPTAAEFAELKKTVEVQHDLIMKLTQIESDHFQYMLKLLQNTRPGMAPTVVLPPPPPPPPPASDSSFATPLPPAPPPPVDASRKVATITGHVDVKGKTWGPVIVYVENIKEPAIERSVEIVQKDRAFVPNVLVVQKGTRVSFPNADPFLHNVFSPSPTSPFDLGSYRQGEKAGTVRLFNPGVVEVLCNMHAKMRANVLVVPNRYHVKASGDGSFRIENVPVGARQVVAWTPDAKPMIESVVLTPAGATVKLALQVEPSAPPLDKMGKPRPMYRQEE